MKRFAELLDRLAYQPARNNKLRLITEHLRSTPHPDRGCALAALTGALTFQHAAPGNKGTEGVRLVWPGPKAPFAVLLAWLEGRADKPVHRDPAPFRPAMLAHAVMDGDLSALAPESFMAEWKWDGIRVQAVADVDSEGQPQTRRYLRTGEDISRRLPDLVH